jgi:5-methyltetrahydropteroyltriglutamate--homocysteine methyltransferase
MPPTSDDEPVRPELAELRARLAEASQYMPLERLALSPQCGFATSVIGNALTVEDEVRKLRTLTETAREVWA